MEGALEEEQSRPTVHQLVDIGPVDMTGKRCSVPFDRAFVLAWEQVPRRACLDCRNT